MVKKSLGVNAILNVIKTIASMVFPLITMPYVNRVLQVENMGMINFSTTFVNYFIQLAALGIANYAIREGARLRDIQSQLNDFCNQIFSINIVTTLISYLLLGLTLIAFPGTNRYLTLILIQSINIIGTSIGISWFYSITEDYAYITIRSLVFQLISLILMFTLIQDNGDTWKYAVILVVSSSGSGLLNYIHSRKYIKIRFTLKLELKKHIVPILVIFSSSIAMIIYVNSDSTMIGIMSGDYHNGLYSLSVKIYTILKNLLASIFVVTLPRLSYYLSNEKTEEYKQLIRKSLSFVFLLIMPIIVGLNLTCEDVIRIVGGNTYLEAATSLRILSVAIFFSLVATYFTISILLPFRREKVVFIATAISAVVNILLNLWLIPLFQEKGAAITTLIAEILVVLIQLPFVKDQVSVKKRSMFQYTLGCIGIVFCCVFINTYVNIFWLRITMNILCGSVCYFVILYVMKNEEVTEAISMVKRKVGIKS